MSQENPNQDLRAQEVPLHKPSKRKGTRRGYFSPKNPAKYEGNADNIIYRSKLELNFMKYLDDHPDILAWSSEEIVVMYRNPLDPPTYKKLRRYFVDFKVTRKQKGTGKIVTSLIELKWSTDTVEPPVPKRKTKRYLNAKKNFLVNTAKWTAAALVCEAKGWEWKIITEKQIG